MSIEQVSEKGSFEIKEDHVIGNYSQELKYPVEDWVGVYVSQWITLRNILGKKNNALTDVVKKLGNVFNQYDKEYETHEGRIELMDESLKRVMAKLPRAPIIRALSDKRVKKKEVYERVDKVRKEIEEVREKNANLWDEIVELVREHEEDRV